MRPAAIPAMDSHNKDSCEADNIPDDILQQCNARLHDDMKEAIRQFNTML